MLVAFRVMNILLFLVIEFSFQQLNVFNKIGEGYERNLIIYLINDDTCTARECKLNT